MAPLYKKALLVGATSGIGEALALKLASEGTHVIATGRRQDRLDALAAKATPSSAPVSTIIQDITDLSAIPAFAASIAATYPDLDTIILNSGIQRMFDFSEPQTVDLAALGLELTTNYLAYVHLVTALLPQLQARAKAGQAAYLVFMSATIGLIPSLVTTPNYNASKAALHSFITTLRQQQIDAGLDQLRIIEVFPPAVQTELHDTKHQPKMVNGDQIGMPLAEFTGKIYDLLQTDPKLYVGIGPVEELLAEGGLEDQRQKLFEKQQVQAAAGWPKPASPAYRGTSRNISARQIELDYLARRQEAERREQEDAEQAQEGQGGFASLVPAAEDQMITSSGTPAPGGGTPAGAEVAASESGSPVGGRTLSAEQMTVVQQIKQKKKVARNKKKRGRGSLDSDDDEDEQLLSALSNAKPERSVGQIENCAKCGKRFTVTAYSRADAAGGLLCPPCSKELAEADDATRKNKKPRVAARRTDGNPVGQRRKTQSRILDGVSPVGVKPLVIHCMEHLAHNVNLADSLGDLPEDVIAKIERMLSKYGLLNSTTINLLLRPEGTQIGIYDGANLVSNDYLRILQEMPLLERLVVYNGIQFKDEVMKNLQESKVRLKELCLHGANLISDETWKEFLAKRGDNLKTLQICQTDKYVTDEVMKYVQEYAPELQRLKINGNQALTATGVDHIGYLAKLQHLGLDLLLPVYADVYVKLLVRLGDRLQTLSLRRATEADNTVLTALHEYGRGLRKLRLTDNGRCTDAGFVRLFKGWKNVPLQFADFERCRYDDPDHPHDNEAKIGLCSAGFQALMAHSGSDLKHLNICSCRHIEQAAFEAVFATDKVYPELQYIEASFCEEITDRIVCSMFWCCPKLKKVATFGCMRVTGVGVPYGRIVVGVPNALGMQTVG